MARGPYVGHVYNYLITQNATVAEEVTDPTRMLQKMKRTLNT